MKSLKKNKKVILYVIAVVIGLMYLAWVAISPSSRGGMPAFPSALQTFTSITIDVATDSIPEELKKFSSEELKNAVYSGCESAFHKTFKFRNVDVSPYVGEEVFSKNPLNINLSFSFGVVDQSHLPDYMPRREDEGSLALVYSMQRTEMAKRVARDLYEKRDGRPYGGHSYLQDETPIKDFSKRIEKMGTYMTDQNSFYSESISEVGNEQHFLAGVKQIARSTCKAIAKKMDPYTSDAENAEAYLLKKMEEK